MTNLTDRRALQRISNNKHRFSGLREMAIKRDGSKCLRCGMTRYAHKKQFKRDITVDHIDGNGRYSKEPNNKLSNLQTLCLPCHVKKDNEMRDNFTVLNANKTHCYKGHEFNKKNTLIDKYGWRVCKACKRIRLKKWEAKRTAIRSKLKQGGKG